MSNIEDIRSKVIGEAEWNKDFCIPVANSENKQLEIKFKEFKKQFDFMRLELTEITQEYGDLTNLIKNATTELMNVQCIILARKKEYNAEKNHIKIMKKEQSRLNEEMVKIENDSEELDVLKNKYQKVIDTYVSKTKELKLKLKWQHRDLESWVHECEEREEDAIILAKYSGLDEIKIQEMTKKIKLLSEEYQSKKNKLDRDLIESETLRLSIIRTVEEIGKDQLERRDLLNQWQQTLNQIKLKDNEISNIAKDISMLNRKLEKDREKIKEKNELIEKEKDNNKNLFERIDKSNLILANLKDQLLDLENNFIYLTQQKKVNKLTIERTAYEVESNKSGIKQLKYFLQNRSRKCILVENEIHELKKQKDNLIEDLTTSEGKDKEVVKYVEQQGTIQKVLEEKLKSLKLFQYQREEIMKKLCDKEESLEKEISLTKLSLSVISKEVKSLNRISLKQMKNLFDKELIIYNSKRKLKQLQEKDSNKDEKEALKVLKELTALHEDRQKTFNFWVNEKNHVKDIERRSKVNLRKTIKLKNELSQMHNDLHLEQEVLNNKIKKIIHDKDEKSLDENLHKIELEKMKYILYKSSGSVMCLEKDMQELDRTINIRKDELQNEKEFINGKSKILKNQTQDLGIELVEKIQKASRLQKKFDVVSSSIPTSETGEEQSLTQIFIKTAQEKYNLRQKGDFLHAETCKLEKELIGLINALYAIEASNHNQKCSSYKIDEEIKEKDELSQTLRSIQESLLIKKNELKNLNLINKEKKEIVDSYNNNIENLTDDIKAKEKSNDAQGNKLKNQELKLSRAKQMNAKIINKLQDLPSFKEQELDVRVSELKNLNNKTIQEIKDVMIKFPSLIDYLQPLLDMVYKSLVSEFQDVNLLEDPNETMSSLSMALSDEIPQERQIFESVDKMIEDANKINSQEAFFA